MLAAGIHADTPDDFEESCSRNILLCDVGLPKSRKAPLNGRRLVPKTRVTARSGVRFLSLPPIPGTAHQASGFSGRKRTAMFIVMAPREGHTIES